MERLELLMSICDKLTQEDKDKIISFIHSVDLNYDTFKHWIIKESPTKIQYYLDIPYFAIIELSEKMENDNFYYKIIKIEQRLMEKLNQLDEKLKKMEQNVLGEVFKLQ